MAHLRYREPYNPGYKPEHCFFRNLPFPHCLREFPNNCVRKITSFQTHLPKCTSNRSSLAEPLRFLIAFLCQARTIIPLHPEVKCDQKIWHRTPLVNALIELVQAVESGKDNETAQPLVRRVEVLFTEMVQKDELQRAKTNGGRPWSGAAKRAFGDIANLRVRMLGV
jgi:hypothetical protein